MKRPIKSVFLDTLEPRREVKKEMYSSVSSILSAISSVLAAHCLVRVYSSVLSAISLQDKLK